MLFYSREKKNYSHVCASQFSLHQQFFFGGGGWNCRASYCSFSTALHTAAQSSTTSDTYLHFNALSRCLTMKEYFLALFRTHQCYSYRNQASITKINSQSFWRSACNVQDDYSTRVLSTRCYMVQASKA